MSFFVNIQLHGSILSATEDFFWVVLKHERFFNIKKLDMLQSLLMFIVFLLGIWIYNAFGFNLLILMLKKCTNKRMKSSEQFDVKMRWMEISFIIFFSRISAGGVFYFLLSTLILKAWAYNRNFFRIDIMRIDYCLLAVNCYVKIDTCLC